MSLADELQKLQQLHQSGAISSEEFDRAKAKLLADSRPPDGTPPGFVPEAEPFALEQQTRQWAMFLHLSQLANYLVPPTGLILPIVLWQIKKAELPGIDTHGKVVVNWILSSIIYGMPCFVLMFGFIGIPLLIALAVVGIIFPIVGGIKANSGEVWKYPLSIPFLK